MARDADDFDLVVIGAGSGGVRAARVAAQLGARVAIVEEGKFGGTCVNAGCIPKKLFVYASELAHARVDARGYGYGKATPSFDWGALVSAKDREITRLNGVYLKLLQDAGVEIVQGSARLAGRHAVQVGTRSLQCKHVLLAVGGSAVVPEIAGRELGFTSDAAFHLPALPERVLIAGGGYVAIEFAGIFRGLGVDVEIVHRGEQILAGFDRDLRDHLARELKKQGIGVRCCAQLRAVARGETGLRAELSDAVVLEADAVMFAIGRQPRTRGLGLEQVGVELAEDGAVLVDGYGRSSLPHVFAVGDCKGGLALTPVATADGQAAAHTMFGEATCAADPGQVPTAVFSQPPLATVGLSEEEARGCYDEVEVYRSVFTPLKHRLTGRATQSLVKLVVEKATQRVVGVHMVGESAPEIMQGFAVALQCGATKAQLDATIGIHPTAAEELVTLRSKA